MIRILLITVFTLPLSGCASMVLGGLMESGVIQPLYTKSGLTQAEVTADRFECQRELSQVYMPEPVALDACMRAKGYAVHRKP